MFICIVYELLSFECLISKSEVVCFVIEKIVKDFGEGESLEDYWVILEFEDISDE